MSDFEAIYSLFLWKISSDNSIHHNSFYKSTASKWFLTLKKERKRRLDALTSIIRKNKFLKTWIDLHGKYFENPCSIYSDIQHRSVRFLRELTVKVNTCVGHLCSKPSKILSVLLVLIKLLLSNHLQRLDTFLEHY